MRLTTNPGLSALAGGLLIVPFAVLNAIVGNRIEPFFSWIRPGLHTSAVEYVLLFTVLFLMPVGSFVALRPALAKQADGRRRLYLVNVILAAIILGAFLLIAAGLGADIYRCDVLKIPNCD